MNLEEIARLAGVSRSTVSRVINDDPRVSDASRERVQQVISLHHFQPNAAARSLASRRSRILGLLIPQSVGIVWSDPFFLHLMQGAVSACNEADYHLTILMDSDDSHSTGDRVYRRVVKGRHVDGLIIAASVVEDPIVERLMEDEFPFVLVGRHPHHEVNFVDVDNRAGAREAVTHLIEHGYRRIGMINGSPNVIGSIDRFAGYVNALQEAGRITDPQLTLYSDFTRRGGYRAMNELLLLPKRPDAVFVASDMMASGALQALRDANCSVPSEMAVFGFDGLEEVLVSQPILSTVVQPIGDLGRHAVQTLLSLLDGKANPPVQVFLPAALSIRRSCGCTNAPSPTDPVGGDRQEVMQANVAHVASW